MAEFKASRNIYADYHNLYKDGPAPKRSMFYKSPYGAEEAPHYIRLGLKYRVWDNLYLQASAKTTFTSVSSSSLVWDIRYRSLRRGTVQKARATFSTTVRTGGRSRNIGVHRIGGGLFLYICRHEEVYNIFNVVCRTACVV